MEPRCLTFWVMSGAFVPVSSPIFQTARLEARRWIETDLEAIHAIYSDPVAMRWVDDGAPLDVFRCRRWMEVTAANYRRRGYGMFAFVERSSGKIVGCGGLVHPNDQPEAEVKYAFRRSHWGRGLASEIVPAILAYGRDVHGLRRIISTVAAEHAASRRVLEKSGLSVIEQRAEDDGSTTCLYEIDFGDVPV